MFLSPVYSSQLSSIYFGLFLPFFPGVRSSNAILTKKPCRNTMPNHVFCLVFSVSMSSLLVSKVFNTSSFFVLRPKYLQHATPNPHIKCFKSFLSFFCNVHVSFPYNAIFHTNALSMRFFQLEAERFNTKSFFLLKACFANAMQRLR